MIMRPVRSVLRRLYFSLTLPLFSILFSQASYACTVHDQLCIYHALGAPVNLQIVNTPANQIPAGNNLIVYSIGTNPTTGAPSTVDFDNKLLLPSKTGDRVFTTATNYNTSTNPAIVSATLYGQANPPPDWKEPGDGGLQVYASQYQVIFNNLTATARHTGDPGGGEENNIPNPTSCPNLPAGARNCEAGIVSGNVPSGIYEQKVRIFNFPSITNPQVDIQAGAYVTGQLVLVSGTHENRQQTYTASLSGTGDISPTYQYEVYNRGWNPHAAGVASYDLSKSRSWVEDTELGDHSHRIDTYRRTDTTHHQIYGDSGWDEKSYSSKTERIGTRYVAAPLTELPMLTLDGVANDPNFVLLGEGTTLSANGGVSGVYWYGAPRFVSPTNMRNDVAPGYWDINNMDRINNNIDSLERSFYNWHFAEGEKNGYPISRLFIPSGEATRSFNHFLSAEGTPLYFDANEIVINQNPRLAKNIATDIKNSPNVAGVYRIDQPDWESASSRFTLGGIDLYWKKIDNNSAEISFNDQYTFNDVGRISGPAYLALNRDLRDGRAAEFIQIGTGRIKY